MNPITLRLSALLMLAGALCAPCLAQSPLEGVVNPIVRQRADPHIFLHSDGYYYMTATVPEYDRIEVRRAETLAGLAGAEAKVIWRKHSTGEMGANIWAPELHHIGNRWYIYFTAGKAEDRWAIRLYVLECAEANPLEGRWIERGQLRTNWESFTLDATTFEHRGLRYLVWTQRQEGIKGTNIYIARMASPTAIEGRQILISRPEYPWEQMKYWVDEAPAALIRKGRVWITFSASATDANYCLGLLSADENADLLDASSWRKHPEPVLRSSEKNGQFGPGHNGFTTSKDGKTDIVVYHSRNYKEIKGDSLNDPNRHTRLQALRWREDGSPDFGEPPPDGPVPISE